MSKKMPRMQQRTLDFDRPPADEPTHVAVSTSLPPPTRETPSDPLVRPDRQIVYPDAPNHYHWPDAKLLHDHDTITVDRIVDDMDGPAHRFVIKRGDIVEAYLAHDKFHVGEVIGISHARQEVRVAWDNTLEKGGWFHVGRIYPAGESAVEPSPSLHERRETLSKFIEKVNAQYGSGLTEADRVPPSVEPPPVKINDRLIIVPVGFRESKPSDRESQSTNVEPPPSPATSPYTFDEFKAFFRDQSATPVPFESFQATFTRILESQDALRSELAARFKAKELQVLASRFGSWDAKRNTKEKNAAAIVQKMLGFFVLEGGVSYSPFSGETYELALKKKVESLTPGEYARHFEQRQEESLAEEKALTNPETFYEFRTFLQRKRETDLTDEQLARYDLLHAESTRERRQAAVKTTVERFQSEELQGFEFEVKEGFHERRQCPLWIVSLTSRVERSTFNELNVKAKMLGGWYSSFKRDQAGFQFTSKEQAERFSSLLQGDADRSDVLSSRKERKEQTAAERLHELADSLAARAEETIEGSNASLQNTARRADIQAGVRGRAYKDLALSRTMHSIAESLSRGEANFLEGVRHRTQIEALDSILHLAKWARIRALRRAEGESQYAHSIRIDDEKGLPVSPADIRFAEFPFPHVYKRHIEDAINACRNKSGARMASERMAKRLKREKEEYITFNYSGDIDDLEDFVGRAKAAGYKADWIDMSLERYRRVTKAGILDIHELRSALREYLPHLAEVRGDDPVKVAERELIGKKLPGFFPTPRRIVQQMLELAAIEDCHRVLEPSCGKGDILDGLNTEHPDTSITAIEYNRTLEDVLSAKGHEVEFTDFLSHAGEYDRIVMNPPFENGQDIEHVRHAYGQLAPGGRLVSVMSEGPFFREDKKATEFRQWIEEIDGETHSLPDDSFQGADAFRQTGVRTRLVVIEKKANDV